MQHHFMLLVPSLKELCIRVDTFVNVSVKMSFKATEHKYVKE